MNIIYRQTEEQRQKSKKTLFKSVPASVVMGFLFFMFFDRFRPMDLWSPVRSIDVLGCLLLIAFLVPLFITFMYLSSFEEDHEIDKRQREPTQIPYYGSQCGYIASFIALAVAVLLIRYLYLIAYLMIYQYSTLLVFILIAISILILIKIIKKKFHKKGSSQ